MKIGNPPHLSSVGLVFMSAHFPKSRKRMALVQYGARFGCDLYAPDTDQTHVMATGLMWVLSNAKDSKEWHR